jgi:hypothetical protein
MIKPTPPAPTDAEVREAFAIPPTHCGGRKYFCYIEDMERADEDGDDGGSGGLDEFVHWSDYDDVATECAALRAENAAQDKQIKRLRGLLQELEDNWAKTGWGYNVNIRPKVQDALKEVE